MNPEKTYLDLLPLIERIAASVARRGGLNKDDQNEFIQIVRVRLWDNDYAIIRKFKEQSQFSTYLHTVILRIFYQCRVAEWGKWRPSAEAKRLGDTAIELERRMNRDGFSFEEAANILISNSGGELTRAKLEALYLRLPPRNPRPVLVSDEAAADTVAVDAEAEDRVEMCDREKTARKAVKALDDAMGSFEAEDRLTLQLRFWDACTVQEIARDLHLDAKKLYKRLEKLFGVLRRALEAAGVSRGDMAALFCHGDQEIDLKVFPRKDAAGPSHPTGEDQVRGGKRRLK